MACTLQFLGKMRTSHVRDILVATGVALAALLMVACRTRREPDRGAKPLRPGGALCSGIQTSHGLELIVLGSGGPRSAGRAASSYLFVLDGVPRLVVDLGPGSFARLGETGLPTARLEHVLLTHLHIDHAGDLAALVKSRDLFAEGPVAFEIVGPTGRELYPSATAFVERLFGAHGAYAYLRSFRNELRLRTSDVPFELDAPPRRIFEIDGVTVDAVSVDHGEVPTLAYRLASNGRSFVVTGDLTSKRGQIEVLARGADVLVYDTAVLEPPGSPENLYQLHTTPSRIGQIAASAGVKTLILGHIPPKVDEHRDEVEASIRRSFHGDVRFAADCMYVSTGGH